MIWIIGNQGLLGKEVARYLAEKEFPHIGTDKEVNILSPLALERHICKFKPSWIVNCSAYTDIDKAETEWDKAYMVNQKGAASVAHIAEQLDIPLIHISSEQVFGSTEKEPIGEKVKPEPLNIYGHSKLAGENAIRQITPRHFIIRTSWLYGEYGPNSVYSLLNKMNEASSFKVPLNRTGTPTWTRDLARLIALIIEKNFRNYGTYHYAGEGECSKWEFAWKLFQMASRKGLVTNPCAVIADRDSGEESPEKGAKRPEYTVLSKEKIRSTLAPPIPLWEESLHSFLKTITPVHLSRYNRIKNS